LSANIKNIDWSECVRHIQQADTNAFRLLYDGFHHDLYKFAQNVVKSQALAEDIVQDTFIKVWDKRAQLAPELSIKSYLFTICRNLCLDTLQKAATQEPLRSEIIDNYEATIEDNDLDLQNEALLHRAIASLPAQRRLVFEKAKFENLSYDQIAAELGISKGTVSDHLVKAMRAVRDYLKK
jgi:RNA polymerase sigma-70 factor (ECF subfamily)